MNPKQIEARAHAARMDSSPDGIVERKATATSAFVEESGTIEGTPQAFDIITQKFDPFADPRIRFP